MTRRRRQKKEDAPYPVFRGTQIAGLNYHIPDGFPKGPKGEEYIRILPFQKWIYVTEDQVKPEKKAEEHA